jgi:multidrug efflux pump subunit AcrA (membrane-fusion protein)
VPLESGRSQKVAFLAKDGARLKKGDPVVEFDPYEAQKEAADGEADLTAARAKIDKAEAEGTKNERSLGLDRDVAKEQLDRAETFKLTDEGLFSRHQIIESQLDRDLFAARADVAGKKLDASGKLSSAERALGEIDAGKAKLKVTIAEKGLRSLRIEAPHDGLLVLERNWRGEVAFVGDTLWPGQKLAELPDLSQLEARVYVLEADGAGLKTGLRARLAIEGRPGEEHEATVTKVEPLAKTRDYQSPVKYFEATLSLARTDPSFMKPGQKARAVVRLEEADGVLAIPRGAVFEKDGKRVVYRREGGGFVPVEITIGRQSISRVVLDSGLAAGDVIALRDPTAKRALGPAVASGAEAGK